MIPLADLAAQFALGSELLMSVVAPRMNKTIHGRLEAGLLYTSAYIARIKAQVWVMHATHAPCSHGLANLPASIKCVAYQSMLLHVQLATTKLLQYSY